MFGSILLAAAMRLSENWSPPEWPSADVKVYGLFISRIIRAKRTQLNPFTPKSNQFRLSPAASPEILPTQYEELSF